MTRNEGAISPEDREKILASARDYIESWLDGDADRMARCLHPELAKRESLEADPSAETMTRDMMVQSTRNGHGAKLDRPY
ncbi:MAG: nuclear transport factor 2 family protein, partial [Chloroflexota bacterium]|nr:nuclear transport factor 2 family protein [Chloroflexota bacterium]